MALLGNINYEEVHTSSELIPAGMYQAIVVESGGKSDNPQTCEDGLVASKSGKGRYLPMTFEIIDGEYKGRQLFKNFNLENQNEQAVAIARGEIKELLQAIGWDFTGKPQGPEDTSEIHMIPLTLQVVIKTNKQTEEPQNEIKHFKPRQSPGYPQPAAPAAGCAAAKPAAPVQPPWAKTAPAAAPAQPAAPEGTAAK